MTHQLRTVALASLLLGCACSTDARDEPVRLGETGLRAPGGPSAAAALRVVAPEVWAAVERARPARVLVGLQDPDPRHEHRAAERRQEIAERAERVLRDLPSLRVERRLANVPLLVMSVGPDDLERLASHPLVEHVSLDRPTVPDLFESVPALHTPVVQTTLGITGVGIGACPPNQTDEGTSAADGEGHGTYVASIVAARGTYAVRGFAPGASIVAVRVENDQGYGNNSDWLAGLDWVLTNLATQPVQVVNMSFGSSTLFDSVCDAAAPAFVDVISQLRQAGVTVFASSGNAGSDTSIQLPACLTGVVAVGATYDSDVGVEPDTGTYHDLFPSLAACSDAMTGLDVVACFSNSDADVDLLAPGAPILGDAPGDALMLAYGTSAASPTAAGVAALMLQANSTLSPDDVESILKSTGTPVTDPRNGLVVPRIDALAAVRAAACFGLPDGQACDDGDSCTATDQCQAGLCVGSSPASDGTSCSDHDACSTGDKCQSGVCTPAQALGCPPTTACSFTLGCDWTAGDCLVLDINAGQACDDGDGCTTGEKCHTGQCNGGQPVVCPAPPDECHAVGACEPATGTCPVSAVPDGTPCAGGQCQAGVCQPPGSGGAAPGPPPDDGNPDNGGCGCEAPGHGGRGPGWAAALLLPALGLTRRGKAVAPCPCRPPRRS